MRVFADYVACKWRHSPFVTYVDYKKPLERIDNAFFPQKHGVVTNKHKYGKYNHVIHV